MAKYKVQTKNPSRFSQTPPPTTLISSLCNYQLSYYNCVISEYMCVRPKLLDVQMNNIRLNQIIQHLTPNYDRIYNSSIYTSIYIIYTGYSITNLLSHTCHCMVSNSGVVNTLFPQNRILGMAKGEGVWLHIINAWASQNMSDYCYSSSKFQIFSHVSTRNCRIAGG